VRASREAAWIRLRFLGWGLIALWQVVGMLSDALPLGDASRPIRIAGRLLALAGLFLVAFGYEQLLRGRAPRAAHGARPR
jgi:hypothetical protein